MTEWNIQSRARSCEACGKSFADKEGYHTVLFDERKDWHRSDVCLDCWEKDYKDARDRKGFISHWKGMFEAPVQQVEAIQKENAETLLRRIIERNDPKYLATAYILAVMLERKRLLKVKEQAIREGRRIFVYEQPRTGDIFTIVDPDLQLNQLEMVQHDVAQLLEHGLPEEVPPPEPQSAPEGDAVVETPSPGQQAISPSIDEQEEASPADGKV